MLPAQHGAADDARELWSLPQKGLLLKPLHIDRTGSSLQGRPVRLRRAGRTGEKKRGTEQHEKEAAEEKFHGSRGNAEKIIRNYS